MCKHNPKNEGRRIDPCLRKLLAYLKEQGIETVSSCCGHGKYPMTIFVKENLKGISPDVYHEICNDIYVESKAKRFYKRDKKGYFFVPETILMNGGKK